MVIQTYDNAEQAILDAASPSSKRNHETATKSTTQALGNKMRSSSFNAGESLNRTSFSNIVKI